MDKTLRIAGLHECTHPVQPFWASIHTWIQLKVNRKSERKNKTNYSVSTEC